MKLDSLFVLAVSGIAAIAIEAHADSPSTITHDVAFLVGEDAHIFWFEIDNPSVRGTLQVTNAPYASTAGLNAAVVDISRDRLIYEANQVGYAIDLSGLQLLQNGVTTTNVATLGTWPGEARGAGYFKSDGQVYYVVDGSDELRYLNFNSSGDISGYTSVGNLTGNPLTSAIRGGDLDFDANGSLWITGDASSGGNPKLWDFNLATLQMISAVDLPDGLSNGITFDAAGQTMYGYDNVTGEYGSIDTTTGGFQSVLATDSTFFGDQGDLAEGTATIVTVPEPAMPLMAAFGGLAIIRRRWKR